MTKVDLTELADEAVEIIRPLAQRSGVSIHIDAEQRLAITGDPAQLSRVIRNLLDNAIRHTPPDSDIRIQVEAASDAVVFRVLDAGPGFPPEIRERAFEPFTRGDPARDIRTGTAGLGLAIADGIVAGHGGTIEIVEAPHGAVEVRLPRPAAHLQGP
jgi:signal transduction histidine kinase